MFTRNEVLGQVLRAIGDDAWCASNDRFYAVMKEMLDQLPPPRWWQVYRRMTWEQNKRYVLTCIYYGWPEWLHYAARLGVDLDAAIACAKLVGYGGAPAFRHRKYSTP